MVKDIIKDVEFLSEPSEPATREDMQTIRDLLDTIEVHKNCLGLAANMIGVKKTILAAILGGEYKVMINPKIVDHSIQYVETDEYCLSLKGAREAKRYNIITVEYLDRKFKKKKGIFRGAEAYTIQHEIDHFNGIII